jgi:hypothetical protein
MKSMQWIMILTALSMAGCASAKKQPEAHAPAATASSKVSQTGEATGMSDLTKLSCTRGQETRTLEVVKKDSGCSLDYTKGGKMKAAASSSHGTQHCVDTQKKIQKKLEQAGFKCA